MMMLGACFLLFLTSLYTVNGQSGCGSDQITRGNIRYSYHENDCNQYRQCHARSTNNEYVIVYRSCPHGQYWNQATLQCEVSNTVNCPIARCSGTTPVEGSGCRAYWQCINRVVSATCCRPGFRYTNDGGCIPDYTCTDPCPGPCAKDNVCRSFPHWENTNMYYKNEDGTAAPIEELCPPGTHYDVLECGCVKTGTECAPTFSLNFNDQNSINNARLNWVTDRNLTVSGGEAEFRPDTTFRGNTRLDQFTVDNPLLIRFSFRERIPATITRTLFLSNDCKNCHQIRVDMTRENFGDVFQVTLRKLERIAAQVTLPTQGFANADWKHAAVWYNGRELLAIVRSGNITYMKRTKAPLLNIMNCGFNFGSQTSQEFVGFLSNIAVYNCKREGRSQDLAASNVNNPF